MKRISCVLILLLCCIIPISTLAETTDDPLINTPTPAAASTTAEPTPTPTPSAKVTASSTAKAAQLAVDSTTLYPGMDKTYAQGYVPTVANGKVTIVLPLRGETLTNEVNLTVDLGATTDNPFQIGNYSQTVHGTSNLYVFTLEIALAAGRSNGSYPVKLKTDYIDTNGENAEQEFTVYVTISDGKTKDTSTDSGSSGGGYVPTADAPELYVESCVITPNSVGGDETFTVHAVVKNIGNKTAYAAKLIYGCDETDITAIDSNNAILLKTIKKGGTVEADFKMRTDRDALAGNRQFFITLSFSARTGGVYTITRKFIINVVQPSRIAFDPVSLPKEITAGETVTLPANVFNTGRSIVRNVTVALEGAGLFPSSSVFLGDIEPGEGKTGEMKVFIGMISMTEGYTDDYGATTGTYIVSYQDSAGENKTETLELKTEIKQPVISPSPTPDPALQQAQSQWWITALVGFAIIAVLVSVTVVSRLVRELRMRE